ncbi:hypothetical protein F5J12DRAFT_783900 [Pisolithus orientalis]|uniref:uncharacterized protein n=1 Tax=Pisolithus orientalis TaxID=936130 RepID=UPI002224645F|nr:uncharacterized protein F5J12DRAFT_783900 [Pisolithus orientalis]KAI6002434.1 hypothetical protein F5J12DRAFT_783900 [Pisolithus orientalis]
MEAQGIAALTGALKCTGRMTQEVTQPEERLAAIHNWVDGWDAPGPTSTHGGNMWTSTGSSYLTLMAMHFWGLTKQQFDINDLFKDYQERVKERAWCKAERLAKDPMQQEAMVKTTGQATQKQEDCWEELCT